MSKNSNRKRSLSGFLRKSFGLGKNIGSIVSKSLGLNTRLVLKRLRSEHINNLEKKTRFIPFGSKLKQLSGDAIRFQIKIKSYKGMRHKQKYPARGQRTHTNAKTKRKMWY